MNSNLHTIARKYWVYPIAIALFLSATHAVYADIRIKEENAHSIFIEITGTITQHDADEFKNISVRLPTKSLTVYLDSKGGDVFAAMTIGRLIRKYDGWTWNESKCYSSCALIFIAGVIRSNDYAELGLHRPYLSSKPQNRETIEKQVPLMLLAMKSYITEMGVTDNFYQQMVNTEPSKIMIIKDDAFTKLFPAHDPVFDEVVISTLARRYGITTSEMRRRDQDAKRCSTGTDCREALRWGLSERVYLERYTKSKKECQFSDKNRFSEEDTETFNKTPLKLRLVLPFFVRFEACTKNSMRDQ